MAIKAIYQHHERTTLAATVSDLQERETGIDGATGYLVGYSATLAAAFYIPSATAQLTANGILRINSSGRLANSSALTFDGTTLALTGAQTISTTLGVTGIITASAGVLVGVGASAQGTIFRTATNGLILRGFAGSTNDFGIRDMNDNTVFAIPNNTQTAFFSVGDNVASAFVIKQSTNEYWALTTTNAAEVVTYGNTSIGPIHRFLGGADAKIGIRLSSNLTDATNKEGRLKVDHYTNSEEPITALILASTTSASTLSVGGGTSTENSVTSIVFYTGINNTTTTGTARYTIANTGTIHTFAGSATFSSTLGVTGLITATAGVDFANGSSIMNYFHYASFTVTLTGVSGTVTGDAYYQIVGVDTASYQVTLFIPALSGTSNTTALGISGIPTAARVQTLIPGFVIPTVVDNSVEYIGRYLDNGDGTATFAIKSSLTTAFSSTFTGSGTKGFHAFCVTYIVQGVV